MKLKHLTILFVLAGLAALSLSASSEAARRASSAKTLQVTIVIRSEDEHGKKGPDGRWHDAFLPANLTVKAGQRVTVTIKNYDEMPHTLTAPGLGLNVMIPMAMKGMNGMNGMMKMGAASFSFIAKKPGRYHWFCALPCDPWSMAHLGYMQGTIRVTR